MNVTVVRYKVKADRAEENIEFISPSSPALNTLPIRPTPPTTTTRKASTI